MNVIEVTGLTKHYRGFRGGTLALDSLDLEVPEGGVFGFLGPNGAGKTTTIRCLLGLVRPTEGECRILGADSKRELAHVAGRIGSIVETPAFMPRFSAQRTLQNLATIEGIAPKRVAEVLQRVGLAGREKDLVRNYSLGMRQRLGLAAAMLKDPELLVVDEPAHGLDPAGIKDIRELIRALANEGRTVFLSSHLLTEVQAICDRVAILSKGRCVVLGSVQEVLRSSRAPSVVVRMDETVLAEAVLKEEGFKVSRSDNELLVAIDPTHSDLILKALARRGLYPQELRPSGATLEEVFLELTQGMSQD